MKGVVLIIGFVFFGFSGFSQKVKKKGNTIYIDKEEYVKIEKIKNHPEQFYISNLNLNPKKLFFVYSVKANDSLLSLGISEYWKIYYPDSDRILFEYKNSIEELCELFFREKIISHDGKLRKDKVEELAKKIGLGFSGK